MNEDTSASLVQSYRNRSVMEIVNLLGSIASITGISLLWLRGSISVSPLDIAWIVGIVSIFLGITAVAIIVIRQMYSSWFRNRDLLVKVAFFALAIPIAALCIATVGVSVAIFAKAVFKAVANG